MRKHVLGAFVIIWCWRSEQSALQRLSSPADEIFAVVRESGGSHLTVFSFPLCLTLTSSSSLKAATTILVLPSEPRDQARLLKSYSTYTDWTQKYIQVPQRIKLELHDEHWLVATNELAIVKASEPSRPTGCDHSYLIHFSSMRIFSGFTDLQQASAFLAFVSYLF